MPDSNEPTSTTSPEVEATKAKVQKQIEFYFSDANLRKDKFMKNQIKQNGGFVAISTLLTFNRLKQLTEDAALIASVFEGSDVLELNEAKDAIKRTKELPADKNNDNNVARSLFVEGIPLDATLDELLESFTQYGEVLFVKMRKDKVDDAEGKLAFNGTLFVEFASREIALAALEKELKFRDQKLENVQLMNLWLAELHKKRDEAAAELKAENEKKRKAEEQEVEYVKGCCVFFKSLDKENNREHLEGLIGADKKERVAFIDFSIGSEDGVIRFRNPEAVQDIVDLINKDEKLEGAKLLEGDEELEYQRKVREKQRQMKSRGNNNKRRRKKY